jgi:hypothetical protein
MRKLPVFRVFGHALGAFVRHLHWAVILSLAWAVPLGLVAVVVDRSGLDVSGPARIPTLAGMAVVGAVAFSSIAVSWHCLVILGERPRVIRFWRLGEPTWRYLGNLLLVLVLTGLASIIPAVAGRFAFAGLFSVGSPAPPQLAVAAAATLVAGVLLDALFLRMALVLPAAAASIPDLGVVVSFHLTRKNYLRLVGLMLLTWFLSSLVGAALYEAASLAGAAGATPALPILGGVAAVLCWLMLFFFLSLLSSLFLVLAEEREL